MAPNIDMLDCHLVGEVCMPGGGLAPPGRLSVI